MPTVDIDRDAAHEAAQRELDKPIYPRPSLTQRLTDWLDDQLYRLVLKGSTLPGGWFTVMVLLILVTVAVVVAVRVARRTLRTNRGDYRLFGAAELSAAEHRATAQQCAARGEWAAAVRHRLRAVARHLEETGVLTPVPGRTAGELARDAATELPSLASEFANAATAFNDVTYGELPGTSAAYQLVADLDDRLRTRAVAVRPATAAPGGTDGWTEVR
ncbi:MAG TPA: DUF4129 domain-containing protein [Mycobacterium sp.]